MYIRFVVLPPTNLWSHAHDNSSYIVISQSVAVMWWLCWKIYSKKIIICTHGNKIKFTYDDEAPAHAVMDVLLQNPTPSECHILAGLFVSYKLWMEKCQFI